MYIETNWPFSVTIFSFLLDADEETFKFHDSYIEEIKALLKMEKTSTVIAHTLHNIPNNKLITTKQGNNGGREGMREIATITLCLL